uniref:Uncharacterized protein n=1 Tax=Anguilla anguilla TaxID=7936 RepID=A0A0E9S7U2_ANGAN
MLDKHFETRRSSYCGLKGPSASLQLKEAI